MFRAVCAITFLATAAAQDCTTQGWVSDTDPIRFGVEMSILQSNVTCNNLGGLGAGGGKQATPDCTARELRYSNIGVDYGLNGERFVKLDLIVQNTTLYLANGEQGLTNNGKNRQGLGGIGQMNMRDQNNVDFIPLDYFETEFVYYFVKSGDVGDIANAIPLSSNIQIMFTDLDFGEAGRLEESVTVCDMVPVPGIEKRVSTVEDACSDYNQPDPCLDTTVQVEFLETANFTFTTGVQTRTNCYRSIATERGYGRDNVFFPEDVRKPVLDMTEFEKQAARKAVNYTFPAGQESFTVIYKMTKSTISQTGRNFQYAPTGSTGNISKFLPCYACNAEKLGSCEACGLSNQVIDQSGTNQAIDLGNPCPDGGQDAFRPDEDKCNAILNSKCYEACEECRTPAPDAELVPSALTRDQCGVCKGGVPDDAPCVDEGLPNKYQNCLRSACGTCSNPIFSDSVRCNGLSDSWTEGIWEPYQWLPCKLCFDLGGDGSFTATNDLSSDTCLDKPGNEWDEVWPRCKASCSAECDEDCLAIGCFEFGCVKCGSDECPKSDGFGNPGECYEAACKDPDALFADRKACEANCNRATCHNGVCKKCGGPDCLPDTPCFTQCEENIDVFDSLDICENGMDGMGGTCSKWSCYNYDCYKCGDLEKCSENSLTEEGRECWTSGCSGGRGFPSQQRCLEKGQENSFNDNGECQRFGCHEEKCVWCGDSVFIGNGLDTCRNLPDTSKLYKTNGQQCITGCNPGAARKDPHLYLPHGGRADFRGANNVTFAMLSAKDLAFNVKFEEADFQWARRLVHGTKMSAAYWVVRTSTGKLLKIEYNATSKAGGIVRETGHRDVLIKNDAPALVVDNVQISLADKKLSVVVAGKWEVSAKISSFPFGNLLQNRYKKLLDIQIKALYKADNDVVAPHGIVGQGYDGDDVGISGRIDKDRSPESTTVAQAEGAIEGTWKDYALESNFATDFKFSRFDKIAAQPRDVSTLTGMKTTKIKEQHKIVGASDLPEVA